jgi:hypothetical protein
MIAWGGVCLGMPLETALFVLKAYQRSIVSCYAICAQAVMREQVPLTLWS